MKHYLVIYKSEGNMFKGSIHISAATSPAAMGKFLDWLRLQDTWAHLWNISITMTEIESILT